jgi:predicted PurR-regulated permease PerM
MTFPPVAALIAPILLILLVLFLYSVAEILLLFFVAILFAIYLCAITESLQRHAGMPRGVGLFTALLLTFFFVGLTGYLIVPPVIEQTYELIGALPALAASLDAQLIDAAQRSEFAGQVLGRLEPGGSYVGGFFGQISGYFQNVVPYVFHGVTFAIHFISVLVMGLYLALRPAVYREGFILLAPPIHRELVRDIMTELGRTLRAWLVGQLIGMVFLGILTWIGLELLNVPYALAFGVFAAAVAIVPFFGTLVSTLLPALFVLGSTGSGAALLVALLGVVVHLIESNLVQPMIMERQVHLPPVLSILAVLIMAHLLHIIGLFVAVPVLCVAMVLVRRVYVHRILEGKGFRRAVRDRPITIELPGEGAVLVHPAAREMSVPTMLEAPEMLAETSSR